MFSISMQQQYRIEDNSLWLTVVVVVVVIVYFYFDGKSINILQRLPLSFITCQLINHHIRYLFMFMLNRYRCV